MGWRARYLGTLTIAALVAGVGGVAGAQGEGSRASAGDTTAEIPVLEGRIEKQDELLEEGAAEISEIGEGLEEAQARTDVARGRVRELEQRTTRLEGELAGHRRGFADAKGRYEERARAAYKGGDLVGLASLLGGMLGGPGGPAAFADSRVQEVLAEGRETVRVYEENGRMLRETSRAVSKTTRDYEAAIAEERRVAAELHRREARLDETIARIGAGKARAQKRLRGLRAEQRERALERAPATGAGGVSRERELRVAREDIVARPVEKISKQRYLELYVKAAREYGFARDWYVLAAVGYVESNHGENMGPSSAGAMGPMQFLPSTWKAAGVDGNGDGVANVMDPEDAIPAAAAYLRDGGAPQTWYKALFTYNHADWYVKKVLGVAEAYRRLAADGKVRPYV